MFCLHDVTRRRLCRLGFWATCIVPCLTVLGAAAWIRLPAYRWSHEAQLAARLGLQVTITEVSLPRPGVIVYRGMELMDVETGQRVARVRQLEVDASGAAPVVTAVFPEIGGDRLDVLWRTLDQHLRTIGPADKPLEFVASELMLHLSGGRHQLTDVRGQLAPTAQGPLTTLSFRTSATVEQPVVIRAWRDRQVQPAASGFDFDTGDAPLPCVMAGSLLPAVRRLGTTATFHGAGTAIENPSGWDGELNGRFDGIALDALITDQFPHKLSGEARAVVQHARFRANRLEAITGSLIAGPGVIGDSLLQAAASHLQLEKVTHAGSAIAYDELGLQFRLSADGLALQGLCRGQPPTILMTAAGRPLLGMASPKPRSVASFVRTLVPASTVFVPANPEAHAVARLLPLPAAPKTPNKQ